MKKIIITHPENKDLKRTIYRTDTDLDGRFSFMFNDEYYDTESDASYAALEDMDKKPDNTKKASSAKTIQVKKEDYVRERAHKIVKGIGGKNLSHANVDKIINEVLHLAKVHLPFKETIPTVDTAGKFDSVSEKSKKEKNDCEVRAIAAVADITYEEAHAYAKKVLKREDKNGTYRGTAEYNKNGVYGLPTENLRYPNPNNSRRMGIWTEYERGDWVEVCKSTVGTFVKNHPQGRYMVYIRKHAFAVIDGKVYGNSDDGLKERAIVLNAWKVELKKPEK